MNKSAKTAKGNSADGEAAAAAAARGGTGPQWAGVDWKRGVRCTAYGAIPGR